MQPGRLLCVVTHAAWSPPQMGSSRSEDSELLSLWVVSCWPSSCFGKEGPHLGSLGSVCVVQSFVRLPISIVVDCKLLPLLSPSLLLSPLHLYDHGKVVWLFLFFPMI